MLALTDELERALGVAPAEVSRVFQRMALFFLKATGTEQDVAAVGDGPVKAQAADSARGESDRQLVPGRRVPAALSDA